VDNANDGSGTMKLKIEMTGGHSEKKKSRHVRNFAASSLNAFDLFAIVSGRQS